MRGGASPFWDDPGMLMAEVAKSGRTKPLAVECLMRWAMTALSGLRRRDRSLMLRLGRGRKMAQIKVIVGARRGLVLWVAFRNTKSAAIDRLETLNALTMLNSTPHTATPHPVRKDRCGTGGPSFVR